MSSASDELNHYLQTFPNHPNNPTARAHAALEALRDGGDEQCLFLRVLLEAQQASEATDEQFVFHCILGLRHVILWQWEQYSVRFVQHLRSLLMLWGQQQHDRLSRTCRRACTITAAVWWKRGWNDGTTTASSNRTQLSAKEQALLAQFPPNVPHLHTPDQLLVTLESQILPTGSLNTAAIEAACLCWETLLLEFGAPSTAVQYRWPLSFHKAAQQQCAAPGGPLERALRCSVTALLQQRHGVVSLLAAVLQFDRAAATWDPHHVVSNNSNSAAYTASISLPASWREYIVLQPNLIPTLCEELYSQTTVNQHAAAEALGALASLTGPIVADPNDQLAVARVLCESLGPILLDNGKRTIALTTVLSIVSRLLANFRLTVLRHVPSFPTLLQAVVAVGHRALNANSNQDDDEEAFGLVLECALWVCEDPLLMLPPLTSSSKQQPEWQALQQSLATILHPLYGHAIQRRLQQAEEEDDDDDVDEDLAELEETQGRDELESLAAIGRLHLEGSIACLATYSSAIPLRTVWEGSATNATEKDIAGTLEKMRLLVLHATCLLTDPNEGECPCIPLVILHACREDSRIGEQLTRLVDFLLEVMEFQRQRLSMQPNNPYLSPLLAKSFVSFLQHWIPAYVDPVDLGPSDMESPLVQEWIRKAPPTMHKCLSLCLAYQCTWPQETALQGAVGDLYLRLARRDVKLQRHILNSGPVVGELLRLHTSTAALSHSTTPNFANDSLARGFFRLPYRDRAKVATFLLLLVGGATSDESSTWDTILQAIPPIPQCSDDDVHTRELTCLCLALLNGIVHTAFARRIVAIMTPQLALVSSLMAKYARDLFVCEAVLRLLRDYATQCLVVMDGPQSQALLQACAVTLQSYAKEQCQGKVRSVTEAEASEGQAYNDILCVLQLLVNLSTKDFIDLYSEDGAANSNVPSSQVGELIFFGLQQILPLMTQGLLQYPKLCEQFFELVVTMMESHPDKVCRLPFDTFHPFLDCLLFGMSHQSTTVAQGSMNGLVCLLREHCNTGAWRQHVQQKPDLIGHCAKRLFAEVIFQPVVRDRMNATSNVLLSLIAADLGSFRPLVNDLLQQIPDPRHRPRLEGAFVKLAQQPNVLSGATKEGYEGRDARTRFHKVFVKFLDEIHACMVLR